MKKIFFCLSLLLGLILPAHSFALEDTAAQPFEIIHKQQHLFSQTAHYETMYFLADLLEEDKDDLNNSEKEKFFSGKNAFTITPFVAIDFSNTFFERNTPRNYFANYSEPGFIYLRVLRL